MLLLLCWRNATFTIHPLTLFPSPSEVYLAAVVLLHLFVQLQFFKRLNTIWGWRVAALSSWCCSYFSPADELDQRSFTADYWLFQKNCVQGLAPAQGKRWEQEDGTGWIWHWPFIALHSPTGLIWLQNCKGIGICEMILFKSTFKSAAPFFFFLFAHWPTSQQLHKQLHQHMQGHAELWYKDLLPQSNCVDKWAF